MSIHLPIQYPSELPLTGKVDEIKQAILSNQVVIVGGETGSGKTTQLPKICLDLGRGQNGLIAHTQPRRLAARSVSQRIAEELGVELGQEVGYQVRFNNLSTAATRVKLMTDGILLAEIQHDPQLKSYDTIIIDEAHERSLNIDFLLGYLKQLLPKRPDLKLIITSATIDLEKFSKHFDQAPIVEVSGRTFPVDVVYRPLIEEAGLELSESIISAIHEIQLLEKEKGNKKGDVLIFLSGEREIKEVADALRKEKFKNTEILPLYARLSNKEQNKVFQAHHGRRIVLATNVAETSITVPGITSVIDPGTARLSRYSVRSKVQRLPIEAISQASANQRAGRCGRVAPGICVRLYSEQDFLGRPEFTDTEITRTNLASVILQMHALGLGDIASFPFLDKPEAKAISDGLRVLQELEAISIAGRLTKAGRVMAKMPVDPRLARMILEASRLACLKEILIVVSAMSVQNPKERPLEKQQAADEKHKSYAHPDSDFLSFCKLWQSFEEERQQLTQNKLRKYCQKNFLSYSRMREWREIHKQLHIQCRELGLKENQEPANEDHIHQAMLRGFISQVARFYEEQIYLGTRNRKFQIFPGSGLFKKKPKWILAAELVETTKLYARLTARIKPEWIEAAGRALLNREYFEPHWEKRRGEVVAFEKVSLYGLNIVEKRKVSFSKIDPDVSRQLFIREALIGMQINTKVDFFSHNIKLIENVNELEEKTRRRDIRVDDEVLFEFYDQRLPEYCCNARTLESWYKKLDKKRARRLFLSEEDLIRSDSHEFNIHEFPDQLKTPSMDLKLAYEFAPGKADDGISVDIPLSALKQLKEENLDWLVPGMLREKCIAMVKALPKQLRKLFVPVPDVVDKLLPNIKSRTEGNLKVLLAQGLTSIVGTRIDPANWNKFELETHLKMNIRVLDESGKLLDSGRDLQVLQNKYAAEIQRNIQKISEDTVEKTGIKAWDFGELQSIYKTKHANIAIIAYPALVDVGDSVSLTLCDNPSLAQQENIWGVVRLLMLLPNQQFKYLKKQLLRDMKKNLLLKDFGDRSEIQEQLIRAAYRNSFLSGNSIPKNRSEFEELYEKGRSKLILTAEKLESLLYSILESYHQIQKQLKNFSSLADKSLYDDVCAQLDELLHADFIADTEEEYFFEIPRYLKAIVERLSKYRRNEKEDKESTKVIQHYFKLYLEHYDQLVRQNQVSKDLDKFRWLIEEYRVSVFAQSLGTKEAISEKRLKRYWQEVILKTNI